jgi:hypothetical protein
LRTERPDGIIARGGLDGARLPDRGGGALTVNDQFQTLWFSGLLLAMSLFALWKGGRIAWRRELANPIFPLRGGRAVALGLFVAGVGALGIVVAVVEGLKLRL